jgi:hypothetical protein
MLGGNMRVLIADDHIPDEDIPNDGIGQAIVKKYSSADPKLEKKQRFMRKVVTKLRNSGLDIYICNRASTLREKLGQAEFNVVVIDLGWFADFEVPPAKREEIMGWDLVDIVKKKKKDIPILLCSERIMTDPEIARGAVENEVLPIAKRHDDTFIAILEATLKFVGRPIADVHAIDFKMYKVLSYLTILLMALALVFLAVGLYLALTKTDIEVGAVTSGLGVITTAMSSLFWKYLRKVGERLPS